jgi:spore coat polysaccharide biosynthesis protein SpsF
MSKPNVYAVVQCRMNSQRLPGKVVESLGTQKVIDVILRKLQGAKWIDKVILATTDLPEDKMLEQIAIQSDIDAFRGQENDVLGRFVGALEGASPESTVIRLTGDNPFVDMTLLRKMYEWFVSNHLDYAAPEGTALGAGAELTTVSALRRSVDLATDSSDREHVTLYLKRFPDQFQIGWFPVIPNRSEFRLTIDTPEDLEFARRLTDLVGERLLYADQEELIGLLRSHPEILQINKFIRQRVY